MFTSNSAGSERKGVSSLLLPSLSSCLVAFVKVFAADMLVMNVLL